MKHTTGKIKAVHLLKFENNDDFIAETENFIKKKKIKTAFFIFLGALRKGDIVSGPKKPVIPPDPFWNSFDNAWETFGVGSVFLGEGGKPQVHIHSSLGKGKKVKMGCVRKNARVFIVIEALMLELSGINAKKGIDPKTGINMLKIAGNY
jgi:predicted DNA-binding protein with PD1-like motif